MRPALANESLLEIRGLKKAFGPNLVLEGIDLAIAPGEIVALLGENGAGKSTLVNIIAGSLRPTAGEMNLFGRPVAFRHPRQALESGIALIHQELSLIRSLSVSENIFLNNYFAGRAGFIRRQRMAAEARAILDRLGGERIETTALAQSLSAADQQTVEIAKALVHDPKILIMDEPTSSLTQHEANALFEVVRRLREEGVTIVFIGHRLEEAFAIADRVVVMRDGALVLDRPAAETSIREVVRNMVGRDIDTSARWMQAVRKAERTPLLTVAGFCDGTILREVSLTVGPGEVVGLFGLVGAGRSELLQTIVGDRQRTAGTLELDGERRHFLSPRHALEAGLVLLPEGRKAQGIFEHRSVYENMNVSAAHKFTRGGFIQDGALAPECEDFVKRFKIKLQSLRQRIGALSGGNQQKVLLSRLLMCAPKVILLDEPTHGVDVRTKAQIYDTIAELAARGVGILMVSSELPEMLINAHRILVMTEGRIVKEITNRHGLSEQEVVQHAFPI